jgi:hypothetical protein
MCRMRDRQSRPQLATFLYALHHLLSCDVASATRRSSMLEVRDLRGTRVVSETWEVISRVHRDLSNVCFVTRSYVIFIRWARYFTFEPRTHRQYFNSSLDNCTTHARSASRQAGRLLFDLLPDLGKSKTRTWGKRRLKIGLR